MPTKLHVEVAIVSAGSTYVAPTSMVDAGMERDAGETVDAGRPVHDASTPGASGPRQDAATGETHADAGATPHDAATGSPGSDASTQGAESGSGCAVGVPGRRESPLAWTATAFLALAWALVRRRA
ncbi:MAG: hypothetical protein QM778_24640 [Myxococcales bacterium]